MQKDTLDVLAWQKDQNSYANQNEKNAEAHER